MADTGRELQAMLDVIEAYMSRWKMKFNSRKWGSGKPSELEDC